MTHAASEKIVLLERDSENTASAIAAGYFLFTSAGTLLGSHAHENVLSSSSLQVLPSLGNGARERYAGVECKALVEKIMCSVLSLSVVVRFCWKYCCRSNKIFCLKHDFIGG